MNKRDVQRRGSADARIWFKKTYLPLKEKYDFVIAERIKRMKDKKPQKYIRIDKALYNYDKLWEDLINAQFKDK